MWLQLRFRSDAETADGLADLLTECGALSVSLTDTRDEPLYEPEPGTTPLWRRTTVTGLFPGHTDAATVLAALETHPDALPLPPARVETLADRAWVQVHREGFEPRCFGNRLWIVPSWAQAPAMSRGQVSIRMDPGLAFGTGSHPTTAMCLEWLATRDLETGDAVDYGCGSGVLAVAAARLGAPRVWAVDTDPQALAATRDNAAANEVGDRVEVCAPEALPPLTATCLVSNILANTLCDLAGTLSACVAPGAPIALAGILAHQAPGWRGASDLEYADPGRSAGRLGTAHRPPARRGS